MILKFRILRLIRKTASVYLDSINHLHTERGRKLNDKWYELSKKKRKLIDRYKKLKNSN